MSKMKAVHNGPGQELPKKNETKVLTLEERIEIANDLQRKVQARQVFNAKLMQVEDTRAELSKNQVEPWEAEQALRVVLEQGNYNKTPLLSFTQRGLIEDFLTFIHAAIAAKLAQIDESISEVKL